MHKEALNILCVEDDAEIREIVALSLRLDGAITLQTAASGDEALRLLVDAARAPDCVLLDMRLPDIDGSMVLAELRALPQMTDVPVIYMTAGIVDEERGALGTIGTISKPFDPLSLATQVRVMLGASRKREG